MVKAILEHGAAASAAPGWHGYVTHVPSGERRSWRRLAEITDFMRERLTGSDTDPDTGTETRGRTA